MLETYMIEQLAALLEHKTLSKVAEVLHISQPAISRSMQKLEDELGVKIFDRTKNRIVLNELGELAARHAQIILAAHGMNRNTASRFCRLQKQMNFRIVAKGLKVTYAFHRLCNGFFVYNTSLSKNHRYAKSRLYHSS